MTRAKIEAAYKAVWTTAQHGNKLAVHYTTRPVDEGISLDTGGRFSPPDSIDVYRVFYAEPFEPHFHRNDGTKLTDAELLVELFAISHEHGHRQSYDAGTWAVHVAAFDRFYDAVNAKPKRPVDRADYDVMLVEERRAWESARTVLKSLGWTAWEVFYAERDRCLKTYIDVEHT